MAGGDGKHLLSLTRKLTGDDRPKQFCALTGIKTLLDHTRQRVSLVVAEQNTLLQQHICRMMLYQKTSRHRRLTAESIGIDGHIDTIQRVLVLGDDHRACRVSPVGHLHVTVDDASWHWPDASGNPVIIQGLPPGRHKIPIELTNAIHQPIDQGTVEVTVPAAIPQSEAH